MGEILKWLRNRCDLKSPQCRSLLISLALVAVGIWAFVELAGVLDEEQPLYLDRQLLLLFRESGNPEEPLGPRWLERAMVDITALGDLAILSLITATIVGYFILRRQYASAAWVVFTIRLSPQSPPPAFPAVTLRSQPLPISPSAFSRPGISRTAACAST